MGESRSRWRGPRGGCGCLPGCASLIVVFVLGGLVSLFGDVVGVGVSVGAPFTQSSATLAGAIGTKAKITDGLPGYVRERLAGNQNFINQSTTVTVGPAEGVGIFVLGAQPGAPAVDLNIVLR